MADEPPMLQAIAALDRALASRPDRDDAAFVAATGALCRARDQWLAEGRTGSMDRARLGRLNAILSIALAGHFPIGSTPWSQVEQARDALAILAGEGEFLTLTGR